MSFLFQRDSQTKEDGNTANILICPTCKSSITLPPGGAVDFPHNHMLEHLTELLSYKHGDKRVCDYCKYDGKQSTATSVCLECKDHICEDCTQAHRITKLTRGHLVVPFTQIQRGLYDHDIRSYQKLLCQQHSGNPITDFCDKCEELICAECKTFEHQGHKLSEIDDSVIKYKLQMEVLLAGLQGQIPTIQNYGKYLDGYLQSMEDTRLKIQSDLENQANTLHTMIDDHKANVMKRVNEMCSSEKSNLDHKIGNLGTAAQSLESNADYLSRLLQHGSSTEILSLHRPLTYRLTQLIHMQLDGIEKKLKIGFSPNIPVRKDIEEIFGSLALGHVPLSQKESQQLSGSNCLSMSTLLPNTLNQVQGIKTFEAKCPGDKKDVWPTGIATSETNDIVVVDRDNKKVKVFACDGTSTSVITGTGANKLGTPFDVTVLQNGNIAVTDHEAEDVKVFTVTGDHVYTISSGFKYPRGITINKQGQIIVVDCHHLQISIHNPNDGSLVHTIKATDKEGKKVLVDPYYVCVNNVGNIFVTDTAAPNIKVFTMDSEYLAQYGTYGTRPDQTLQPFGICSDDYGYLHVADNHNDRVHLLKPDGNFHKFLMDKEDGVWHPMAVTVNSKGELVISEALGKIKTFKYI